MDQYIFIDQSSSSHSSDSFESLFQEMESEFRTINSHVEAEWKEMSDVLNYKLANSHINNDEYQSQIQNYKELMDDYCERLWKRQKDKFETRFQELKERTDQSSKDDSHFENSEENVEDHLILMKDADDPSNPPNHDLHLENSPNPSKPYLTSSDQPNVGNYSCFEEIIFEDPLDENDFIMNNNPLDSLDLDSRDNLEEFDLGDQMIEGEELQFEDSSPNISVKNNDPKVEDFSWEVVDLMEIDEMKNQDIFEDSPSLSLKFPSFKDEPLASWSKENYGSELQIPCLAPLTFECEPSPSNSSHSSFNFSSYFLIFDAPPPLVFEPFVHHFFFDPRA